VTDRQIVLPLWLLVVVVTLSIHLGGFPLFDPDEGRNAEVGREMALTNDYVMPRLDGLPYLDKPVVYFAAEAAAMEVLGPTETAARLPAFLFTLATAALCFWFARRTGGDPWIAAIVMLAMPLTIAFSRTVIFDSVLSFFIVLAMMAFYLAVENVDLRAHWAALAWLAIGLGVITKGPVAIALPLLVAIPYAIWRRRFGALWSWLGLVAFVLAVAPWVWAISRVVPDFLHYVLVTETAQRLATKALKRTGPPWYFIPYLIGGALPWSLVLLGAPRSIDRRDRASLYLLLWVVIPFLFFSLSQSKRPQYILPLMPAIALLVARVWPNGRKTAAVALIALALLLSAALPLACGAAAPGGAGRRGRRPFTAQLPDEYGGSARHAAIAIGVTALAGGLTALLSKRRDLALIGLTLPIVFLPLATNPLMNAIGARRSTRDLAARVAPLLGPATEVVGVEAFTGSMPFYLGRPVTVVTPDAEEFTSNYLIRHYATFAGSPTLKPMSWLPLALNDRAMLRIFIARDNDAATRGKLEGAGLRVVAGGGRYVAYARNAGILPAGRMPALPEIIP
jgi:4-amino-4-deoxy-L-arabinose transferase-like glycosyltransferase